MVSITKAPGGRAAPAEPRQRSDGDHLVIQSSTLCKRLRRCVRTTPAGVSGVTRVRQCRRVADIPLPRACAHSGGLHVVVRRDGQRTKCLHTFELPDVSGPLPSSRTKMDKLILEMRATTARYESAPQRRLLCVCSAERPERAWPDGPVCTTPPRSGHQHCEWKGATPGMMGLDRRRLQCG